MRTFLFIITILITAATFGQTANQKLIITHVTKGFYVYTTFGNPGDGSLFPANSMYVVTDKGVVLFDTPWDTTQFQPLLDSIQLRHHKPVILCISTHFHSDRTAGLAYYQQHGIATYTTKLTDSLSQQKGGPRAANIICQDTTFRIGQYTFETFYPGKGHSPDNIVLWFGKEKLLYGGCFVKSMDTDSPGNLLDANVAEWIASIKKVETKFGQPNYIITGHQSWKSKQSLVHTSALLKAYQQKTKHAVGD